MKKNKKITPPKSESTLKSRVAREIIFILFAASGLIYLVALLSYSPSENPYSGGAELGTEVQNLAGIFGAWLGDISLSYLGFASYILPLGLFRWGYAIHKKTERKIFNGWIFAVRFLAVFALIGATSALFAQIAPDPAGGDIGKFLDDYFRPFFGTVAWVFYLGVMMIGVSLTSSASWHNIFGALGGGLFALGKKISSIIRIEKSVKIPKTKPEKIKPKMPRPAVKTKTRMPSARMKNDLPPVNLLDDIDNKNIGYRQSELDKIAERLVVQLKDFGFEVRISEITPGPVVTRFEVGLAPGARVSQIMNLSKDLARALLVESVRIVDVIPGKPVIGIEIPNSERELIGLRKIITADAFSKSESVLSLGLGKNISGEAVVLDLAKMPHLLMAGATGMGKSVGINAMILSILYKATAEQVRMIMIDPKVVELAGYTDIPHLLAPVITDMNEAAASLWWCVGEMERRYLLLAKFGVRNIQGFNDKLNAAKMAGEPLLDPFFKIDENHKTTPALDPLPLIVVVIDEYADMLSALAHDDRAKAKRVEALIVRLAQKARAAGIHLVIATQRPSVDVITGLIKSNVPSRIAFKTSSKIDSRTILDQSGAEQLLGLGDMLLMSPGISHLTRVHGAFVKDNEIMRVVDFLRKNSAPNYLDDVLKSDEANVAATNGSGSENGNGGEADPLYDQAVEAVVGSGRASISNLQRQFKIGYNRAARIIEEMEKAGIVSPMGANGMRDVLAPKR